jgi:hypothetical protein
MQYHYLFMHEGAFCMNDTTICNRMYCKTKRRNWSSCTSGTHWQYDAIPITFCRVWYAVILTILYWSYNRLFPITVLAQEEEHGGNEHPISRSQLLLSGKQQLLPSQLAVAMTLLIGTNSTPNNMTWLNESEAEYKNRTYDHAHTCLKTSFSVEMMAY